MKLEDLDFDALTKEELEALIKKANKALSSLDARNQKNAAAAAAKIAAEYGISLEALAEGIASNAHGGKNSKPPKYANPADPGQTWTGQGRKPKWVIEHLEGGGDIQDLAIDKAA